MNPYLKNIIASVALASFSLHIYAMKAEQTTVKIAIQEEIESAQNAVRFAQKLERSSDNTILGIHYKLTAMKVACFPDLCFTFECSDKGIEEFFKTKLNIK